MLVIVTRKIFLSKKQKWIKQEKLLKWAVSAQEMHGQSLLFSNKIISYARDSNFFKWVWPGRMEGKSLASDCYEGQVTTGLSYECSQAARFNEKCFSL